MADQWTVQNQQETSTVVAGTFVPAIKVTFETIDGDTGSVTIPQTQYSTDTVRAAIDQRVETMRAVKAL